LVSIVRICKSPPFGQGSPRSLATRSHPEECNAFRRDSCRDLTGAAPAPMRPEVLNGISAQPAGIPTAGVAIEISSEFVVLVLKRPTIAAPPGSRFANTCSIDDLRHRYAPE
jgi:hypothetical protein